MVDAQAARNVERHTVNRIVAVVNVICGPIGDPGREVVSNSRVVGHVAHPSRIIAVTGARHDYRVVGRVAREEEVAVPTPAHLLSASRS